MQRSDFFALYNVNRQLVFQYGSVHKGSLSKNGPEFWKCMGLSSVIECSCHSHKSHGFNELHVFDY